MALIKGTDQPQPQPSESEWSKRGGWTTISVWETVSHTAALGMAQQLIVGGYTNVRVFSPDGIKWRIQGSIPKEEGGPENPPINRWEIYTEVSGKDVLSNVNVQDISAANIRAINLAVENREPLDGSVTNEKALKLYDLMFHGQNSFFHASAVLRHTEVVATIDNVVVDLSRDLKLHDFSDLPSNITPTVLTAINTIPAPPVLPNTYYAWSWLKMGTTVIEDIEGRVEIGEQWTLAYWSNLLYQAV